MSQGKLTVEEEQKSATNDYVTSCSYLFWVSQGTMVGGLYRLDLHDISNGVKHEVRPDVIMEDPNLGAFTVDHTNFRLLVANHSQNTVVSVSLDG
jgi:proto-oncogene tyrosine-protein kinase ROS